ncbi:kinase-like domain-containing protein [Ochromonadaceae sp. CCMP2298]|nr:kinase-like domain-containing protein [Ochromonadaceae sp. CCMP2298]
MSDGPSSELELVFSPNEIELTETILGRGAFGEVRVARWRNIEVACKSLHSLDASDESKIDQGAWRGEIQMLSKLRHPNLVLFLGICEGPITPMILTELLPCSLYDLLEGRRYTLELPDILDLALDIARGLDYLHRHSPQIVHRDISSKNILVGRNAKIADLGQAKIFGDSMLSRQTGMPGAMAYAAPEVLTGRYSSKIDIFSCGVLFAQMCSGDYPRIDRREVQIGAACGRVPILAQTLEATVAYSPSDRPTAASICQTLEALRRNDRHYPVSRRTEKDLGILGRAWMRAEIARQCEEVGTELRRTQSLLLHEEERWRAEAGRVDGINMQLAEAAQTQLAQLEALGGLRAERASLECDLRSAHAQADDLKVQMGAMGGEMRRLSQTVQRYETQLAQQAAQISSSGELLKTAQDAAQVSSALLEGARASEQGTSRQNEQVRLQLNMQLEYVRDLEARLEQALTRWRGEKDNLRAEQNKNGKLNSRCSGVVAANARVLTELGQYQVRLKQYEDLPLPRPFPLHYTHSPLHSTPLTAPPTGPDPPAPAGPASGRAGGPRRGGAAARPERPVGRGQSESGADSRRVQAPTGRGEQPPRRGGAGAGAAGKAGGGDGAAGGEFGAGEGPR